MAGISTGKWPKEHKFMWPRHARGQTYRSHWQSFIRILIEIFQVMCGYHKIMRKWKFWMLIVAGMHGTWKQPKKCRSTRPRRYWPNTKYLANHSNSSDFTESNIPLLVSTHIRSVKCHAILTQEGVCYALGAEENESKIEIINWWKWEQRMSILIM